MKRVGLLIGILLLGSSVARAGEPTTLAPPVAVTIPPAVNAFAEFVKRLDPSEERVFLFHGTGFLGTSASIIRLTSHHYPIANLRLGFADANPITEIYAGQSFDLPGIAERFTPESVKSYFTNPLVAKGLSLVGQYGRVSLIEGRNFRTGKGEFGVSVGASVTVPF